MIKSYSFGHEIVFVENTWLYADNRKPISQKRPCSRCGKYATKKGYDPCLGHIPGATAACCGHGVEEGFIQYNNNIFKINPMANIEKLAFEAHKEDRQLVSSQQTPDHFWSDWFCKGYRKAEKDARAKAIAAFDEMWLAEDDFEPDYEYHRKKFIEKLNS